MDIASVFSASALEDVYRQLCPHKRLTLEGYAWGVYAIEGDVIAMIYIDYVHEKPAYEITRNVHLAIRTERCDYFVVLELLKRVIQMVDNYDAIENLLAIVDHNHDLFVAALCAVGFIDLGSLGCVMGDELAATEALLYYYRKD